MPLSVSMHQCRTWPRRTLLAAACGVLGCARTSAANASLQPLTAEGGPRQLLVIEIVRQAHVTGLARAIDVSACRWHISAAGALYGDHWGWCEDFVILPRTSPGYLLLTTEFTGDMSGGYGKMVILPPLPAAVDAFGHPLQIVERAGRLWAELGGVGGELRLREAVPISGEQALVEPPIDTGHFEPGFDQPVPADVSYSAISYGLVDSRRIAGRSLTP